MLQRQDVLDFSIAAWQSQFSDILAPLMLIPIPENVVECFKKNESDSDVLRACSEQFLAELKRHIQYFGGEVFVKDNWNAPMDAKMLSLGFTLKTTCVQDLFLYLTSSQTVLTNFLNDVDTYYISMQKWVNIHPASEFRGIVVNNMLRGVTPRDWPEYYAHFKEEGFKIIEHMLQFFLQNIQTKFCRQNFTFDVYINYPDDMKLVDFGPLNKHSNLYAFKWPEIQALIQDTNNKAYAPVFRYLENDMGIVTKTTNFTTSD